MRIRDSWLIWVLVAVFWAPAMVQASTMSVREAGIGTDVVDRVLQGSGDSFDASVGKLYAYTRIVGADEQSQVSHRWYYNDHLMAEVTLPVRGDNWRTWSSKSVVPMWVGDWRVDVVSSDGSVIESLSFKLQ